MSHKCVLQVMGRSCQFSEGPRLNRILPVLEISYRTLRNARLARKQLCGKLLGFGSDLIEVFRVHHPFVFSKGLIRQVQDSRVSQNRQVGSARPAGSGFFANVMKLTSNNVATKSWDISMAIQ